MSLNRLSKGLHRPPEVSQHEVLIPLEVSKVSKVSKVSHATTFPSTQPIVSSENFNTGYSTKGSRTKGVGREGRQRKGSIIDPTHTGTMSPGVRMTTPQGAPPSPPEGGLHRAFHRQIIFKKGHIGAKYLKNKESAIFSTWKEEVCKSLINKEKALETRG